MWGERVAIHAGARPVRKAEIEDLLAKLLSSHWRETGLDRDGALPILTEARRFPKAMPLSSVLCLATLGQPIRDAELAVRLGLPHLNDSDRDEHSNWGWPLTGIERLEPFAPARGYQGWWTWTVGTAP
jgi:hypothetical protein